MSENKKSTKHAFKAPAFQLYAKEFLQDEAVIAMELEAVGAYIILLCHQWTEGSIPADPALVARICRTTTERIEAIWPQLEGKFSRKESHNKKRLVNRKLELIRKEKNNFNASQTQHGLNGASARWHPECNRISPEINDLDGVAQMNPIESGWDSDGSGSGSGSGIGSGIGSEEHTHTDSETEKEPETPREKHFGNVPGTARWKADDAYHRFVERYQETGAAVIDADFTEAFEFCWKTLDWEQKAERVKALEVHYEEYAANPRFVPKPLAFLEKEWQRPVRPPAKSAAGPNKQAQIEEDWGGARATR
jgi:uncharacterized protein YdaU (DUF1376 family)